MLLFIEIITIQIILHIKYNLLTATKNKKEYALLFSLWS